MKVILNLQNTEHFTSCSNFIDGFSLCIQDTGFDSLHQKLKLFTAGADEHHLKKQQIQINIF